jgi:hypothetical protein
MVVEANRGVTLFGKARGPDMYAACDLAEQKLAQQLRKHKERLTDHHRGARRGASGFARRGGRRSPEPEMTYEDVIEEMKRGD